MPTELSPSPADCRGLVSQAAGGDRCATEKLVQLYQQRMARFVIAQTGDASQYEDLCQTIFVKMILALPRLREQERFEPWLFQIARNVCRDHLRARRSWRKLFVAYEDDHDCAVPPEAPGDAGETLHKHIARLPEAQRQILRLSLEERSSYGEMARRMGSSISAVKSRLHRARESLRALILTEKSE